MIESQYWRDELKADIRWLRSKQKYKRWSEKQRILFERKLMLVAFQVRTLLEQPKVNESLNKLKISGLKYHRTGSRIFTLISGGDLEDCYDLSSSRLAQLFAFDRVIN